MSRTYGRSTQRRSPSEEPRAGPSRHRDDHRSNGHHGNGRRDSSEPVDGDSDDETIERKFRGVPSYDALAAREREEEGETEEDPRLQWTVDNFENVPITTAAAQHDLRATRDMYDRLVPALARGMDEVIENARDLEMVSPDHEDINKLQMYLIRLINAEKEREIRRATVQEILDELRAGATFNDLHKELEKRGDERVNAWNSLTAREKFKDDDKFKEFRTTVWDVHHDDEPIPPMTHWLDREGGDEESDDEIQAGGTLQTYRCPITLTHLENACKSRLCGHHYSYEAIMNHINASRGRGAAKCPVGACNARLTKTDIVVDPRMQKLTDVFLAKQARREAAEQESFDVLDD